MGFGIKCLSFFLVYKFLLVVCAGLEKFTVVVEDLNGGGVFAGFRGVRNVGGYNIYSIGLRKSTSVNRE